MVIAPYWLRSCHSVARRSCRDGAKFNLVSGGFWSLSTIVSRRSYVKHDQTGSNITLDLPLSELIDEDSHLTPSLTDLECPINSTHDAPETDHLTKSRDLRLRAKVPLPIPVYITGGSGDLANAIAHAFASHPIYPFQITLVGRSAERLRERIEHLPKSANKKWPHGIMEANVIDPHCWNMKNERWAPFPKPGTLVVPAILVNCAGASYNALLSKSRDLDVVNALHVNLYASIWSCRAFASRPYLTMRRKMMQYWPYTKFTPSIINIGSILGQQGGLGSSIYTVAKAGLLGLTRSAAAEYGRLGIRVNAVVPGVMRGAMTSKAFSQNSLDQMQNMIPLQRLAEAEEVADAVVFLALNNYANNCVLNLDGGLSAVGPIDHCLRTVTEPLPSKIENAESHPPAHDKAK